MAITAALVKELRERTGAGMMECKKALVEMDGDIEAALEHLRKTSAVKADKKAGRIAAEGLLAIELSDDAKSVAIVEVNCETDFAAKREELQDFVSSAAKRVLSDKPSDVDELNQLAVSDSDNTSIEETRKGLVAKIGENISVRRFVRHDAAGTLAAYKHGARIGVIVDVVNGDEALGKDIAMHIAASRPQCVSSDEVDQSLIAKEREIYEAKAKEEGKPDKIIPKIVDGQVKKFLKEITLLGQPFVKDPDQTVEQLLKSTDASVSRFIRFEVGEGIEKKQENFAEEVMAQANATQS